MIINLVRHHQSDALWAGQLGPNPQRARCVSMTLEVKHLKRSGQGVTTNDPTRQTLLALEFVRWTIDTIRITGRRSTLARNDTLVAQRSRRSGAASAARSIWQTKWRMKSRIRAATSADLPRIHEGRGGTTENGLRTPALVTDAKVACPPLSS